MDFGVTIDNDVTMSGATGTLLANRYRVVRQLGQGGMGSVWLAEDTKLDGFRVAIKMLPSILVNNKRAYAQVKAEALVSLKLTHTNIAAVRAFEEEHGSPFLVMDYIDGQSLDDYLAEKGTLTEEEAIQLLKPVAEALDYAHAQGVVHRDVKPGNVMIRRDGTPFVLDFGIAREIQETMTRVTGKLSSGTLMYMSPEQLHGVAPKPAQDVYSFAAMAYECLAGRPPFSRGQIEYQIEHDTPAPLGPQFIKCGSGVMAGLAKTPEARPATCAAVLSAGSRVPRERRGDSAPVGKTRILPISLGLLALVALVGVGGWWLGRGGSAPDKHNTDAGQTSSVLSTPAAPVVRQTSAPVPVRGPQPGDMKTVALPGGETMEMVWCPPGSFQMGSPTSDNPREDDETSHRVTLTQGFWMGKYEVTQRQWESVMGANPSEFKGPSRPVENVSWNDCQEFIRKVNAAGRVTVSLPTEAQWEYACRAGTTTPYAGDLDEMAWHSNNSSSLTHDVGTKKPNAWGLYDMHGNVWEWCADWYGAYSAESVSDPTGPASGGSRVYRGGCWLSYARRCRSANRGWNGPSYRFNDLGFRLACSAGPRR